MIADQIIQFLTALGAECPVDTGNGWVACPCPLAPFYHKSGTDSHPSFAVKIVPGGESGFNCYSCLSGSLGTLLGTLELQVKAHPEYAPRFDFKAARAILDGQEIVVPELGEYEEFHPGQQAEFEEWPEWWLESFPTAMAIERAHAYLRTRGVPDAVTIAQDLRWDGDKQMIVAPYRNLYGKLAGARGRSVDPACPKPFRHFDYTWNKNNNAKLVWYGEECLQLDMPVVVVEGQFDRMKVQQVYPSVVAGLSAKVHPYKLKRLSSCHTVVLMLDNDDAGKLQEVKYATFLSERGVRVGFVQYPEQYKDPDQIPLDELRELLTGLH